MKTKVSNWIATANKLIYPFLSNRIYPLYTLS